MTGESKQYTLCRPRSLTLVVLMAAAAAISVANFSHDALTPQLWPPTNPSFGWPLIWYRCEFKPGSALIGGGAPRQMHLELVCWSGPRLAGNITIWLVVSVVVGVACQWLLRRYAPQLPNRPRPLTLIVLIVVAAPIVLANLSHDDFVSAGRNPAQHPLYGWPLIWRWRNLQLWYGAATELNENYSATRLAGNLAMWVAMLVAAGCTCEWLLRRYRPRLRWSLRTMLATVGLVAVLCAWCTALRNRANLQDPIIAEYEVNGQDEALYLDRWGPKWLDLVGADRFRRIVVGAVVSEQGARHEPDEELLKRLQRLRGLRYLYLSVAEVNSEMTAALANMRQLRILRVSDESFGENEVISDCMEAIGKLAELEELHLSGSTDSDSLAHLEGLAKLKSLSVLIESDEDDADWDEEEQEPNDGERKTDAMETNGGMQIDDEQVSDETESGGEIPLLAHLPALPRLEAIDLRGGGMVGDQDLRQLAVLPRLKSLNLSEVHVTDGGLAELVSLKTLEELAISGETVSAAGLHALLALKRLKALHMQKYMAVTDAALAELPDLESMEKVRSAGGAISGVGSQLLWSLKSANAYGAIDQSDRLTTLALDHGDAVFALESELDGLRRALDALRRSNPDIVIDSDPKWFDQNRGEKRQEPHFFLAPVR